MAPGVLQSARNHSSRAVGPLGSHPVIHSNNTSLVIESQEIGPSGLGVPLNQDETFNKMIANVPEHPQIGPVNQEQSKTHRTKEPVLHDFRQPKDSLSTIR